jgi:hypothetical protein
MVFSTELPPHTAMPATLLSAIQVVILSAKFNIEMVNKITNKKCSRNIHHVNTSAPYLSKYNKIKFMVTQNLFQNKLF